MAYREQAPAEVCARHPAAAARARCERCEVLLCECCVLYDGVRPGCRECSARVMRRRRVLKTATATAGVLFVLASALWLRAGTAHAHARLRARELEHRVRVLGTTVDVKPCDVDANIALVAALREQGDEDEVLVRVREYCTHCERVADRAPWSCAGPFLLPVIH